MKVAKIEKQILKHLYAATDWNKKLFDAGAGDPTLSLHIAEAIISVKEGKAQRKFAKQEKKAQKGQDAKIVPEPVAAEAGDVFQQERKDLGIDD